MKESVLEIKIEKIDDKWSVAKFTKIENIKDSNYVEWSDMETRFFTNIICINKQDPHKPFLVYNKDINILTSLVAVINREPMVWRARCGKHYYFINKFINVDSSCDTYSRIDDNRYKLGNYFQTEKEAIIARNKILDFWKKIKTEEI